jgi:hypothetical protein
VQARSESDEQGKEREREKGVSREERTEEKKIDHRSFFPLEKKNQLCSSKN